MSKALLLGPDLSRPGEKRGTETASALETLRAAIEHTTESLPRVRDTSSLIAVPP
jgi:hypothetical protein